LFFLGIKVFGRHFDDAVDVDREGDLDPRFARRAGLMPSSLK
jgi:hypothetical protein